jgi:hypothetical protein
MKKKLHLTLGMVLLSMVTTIQVRAQWGLSGNAGTTNANFIGTTDYKSLKIKTFNADRITISEDGYVSVGTVPAFGSIGAGIFTINSNLSGWSGMYVNGTTSSTKPFYGYAVNGSASTYHFYDVTSGSWRLHMLGADRFVITQFGLVGIGTTNPTEMLHVVGNGKITGNLSSTNLSTGSISATSISTTNFSSGSVLTSSIVAPVSAVTVSGDFVVNGDIDFNNANTFFCRRVFSTTTDSEPGVTGRAAADPNDFLWSAGVFGDNHDNGSAYGIWSDGPGMVTGDIETWGDVLELSDAQFKTNVTQMSNSLDMILQLKPSKYNYKTDEKFKQFEFDSETDYGFIAQELEKIFPSLVKNKKLPVDIKQPKGETIDFKMVNYVGLIPFLTKGIQEQQMMIDQQNSEIDQLKSQINELNEKMLRLENLMDNQLNNGTTNVNRSSQLFVNNPNPFDKQTTIRYFISQNVITASILLMDMNGKVINTFELTQKGEGSITVQGDQLTSGLYSYILMIDGNVADSKKMIVNK